LLFLKQEDLDQAFNSVHISFASIEIFIETMEERINKVRLIYGTEDWDRRVEFLADSLTNKFPFMSQEEVLASAAGILGSRLWDIEDARSQLFLHYSDKLSSILFNSLPEFNFHGKVTQTIMIAALLFMYQIRSIEKAKELAYKFNVAL
jgi:hypothetical protein